MDVGVWFAVGVSTDLCVTLAAELPAPGLDADDPAVEEHSVV